MDRPWAVRLHGTPCACCSRPAEGIRVFGGERRVYHSGGGLCVLPTQPERVTSESKEKAA